LPSKVITKALKRVSVRLDFNQDLIEARLEELEKIGESPEEDEEL